ncbi:MAG TPA: ATP-binding protein [Pyrinomonadaceae bacterium]|nr:ATP-binding protein [Pyrinomonadaceae bacterium]
MIYQRGEKPVKVLLVEDDEDDYLLAKDLFEEIAGDGYELEWVRSFDDALKLETPDCYDICLLDYRLGEHDGIELMSELRSRGFNCPMILLTGQGDLEVDRMATIAGASDYLVKGQISPAALERSVRYAIQQRLLENERINHIREQEARVQAEAANRAKDDFLAVLSHELRTPLNAMLGWARLLRTNKDNDDIFVRAVDAIERSALMQTKFVDDLLDVTRIVNGQLSLARADVDLGPLVEAAIDGIQPTADAKSIEVKTDIDKEIGIVSGDPERIQQIVNNLLSNAVKFTPEGGTVSVLLEKEDGKARLQVADTGVGISKEFLPQVFDRYKQAHNATTNRKGGLGLGLAIVRYLVEKHDGTVGVDSDGEGKGATFTVHLPLMNRN